MGGGEIDGLALGMLTKYYYEIDGAWGGGGGAGVELNRWGREGREGREGRWGQGRI